MTPIDPATQKYFEDYLDLFATPGWQTFVKDMKESLETDQKSAVSRCDTTEKWFEERGAQAKTLRILAFETMIRNNYDNLKDLSEETVDSDED